MNHDAITAVADQIARAAADLDDVMFTMLREAAADRRGRPADDKRLMQARRALDKAEHVLRSLGTAASTDDWAGDD